MNDRDILRTRYNDTLEFIRASEQNCQAISVIEVDPSGKAQLVVRRRDGTRSRLTEITSSRLAKEDSK